MHTLPVFPTMEQAISAAASAALTAYPQEAARLLRAIDLALDGHVSPNPDGTAQVRSQCGTALYTVTDRCTCPDRDRASEGRCKHWWARELVREALASARPYYRRNRGQHYAGLQTLTRAQVETALRAQYNGTSGAQLAALDAGRMVQTPFAQFATDSAQLPLHVRRLSWAT